MKKKSTKLTPQSNKTLLRFSYNLLLFTLFPIVFAFTIKDMYRRRGGIQYLKQRFGFTLSSSTEHPIWIHAASVGEVNAAIPLISALQTEQPTVPLYITTATATAARVLLKQKPSIEHCYLPLDYPWAINHFLKTVRPRIALIMETELWPNLFHACYVNKTPIIIINGRMSDKTFKASRWQKKLYQNCLQQCASILARGQIDQDRFIELGANPQTTKTIGNLKFSTLVNLAQESKPPLQSTYILAASTHDDEEFTLAKLWQQLNQKDTLLVIAPRHPERRNTILKQLQSLGLHVAVRSRNESISPQTDIYLADTMGELCLFIQHAKLVFMGGSLIPHGGQNILEPASLGKAMITGPYMQNFSDELQQLKQHEAIIQVPGKEALSSTIRELLDNQTKREQLGNAAKQLIQSHQSTASNYIYELRPYLNSTSINADKEE